MRALLFALLLSVLLLQGAHAQLNPGWSRQPSIVVIAADGDPRITLVDEAIGYWNRVLEEAGSPFRLPAPARADLPIPEQALQELSDGMTRRPLQVPQALRSLPGDMTILLAHSAFVSFAVQVEPGKRVVGIRNTAVPPLNRPNVARNLIAHELGHAIGLGHNADPAMLMCGRPAPCRPPDYAADREHFFPVMDDERRRLRTMYPPP